MTDFIYGITPGDIAYDIETYPNCFTITLEHCVTGEVWQFEISPRVNQLSDIIGYIDVMRTAGCRMVGFNNLGFDYPVVHFIYKNHHVGITVKDIYDKAMSIIKSTEGFAHQVWESDWIVPQIDLYKIHHFDNRARSTSLKVLEFNMRMDNIEDLPFAVGTDLTNDQIDVLLDYNHHDVKATILFYRESKDQIAFREELSATYGRNFLNHNDTKIGKDYFIMKLEEHTPGCCYTYVDGRRRMVQTPRDEIVINDIILPVVNFHHPEFQRVLGYLRSQTIYDTVGVFKDVSCVVNGFKFVFGTGGIHGSVEHRSIASDDEYLIEDWDVASYYPNLAIANKLYPEHLGQAFCDIYSDVYRQRQQYKKGTAQNAMLKLALNGVYGDSNNQYSPFFDSQYTMSITINGQLLLCMLAEQLMNLGDLEMIQINTDGMTVRYPRKYKQWVHEVAKWWENVTGLTLESAEYSRMWVRDVNNYLAEYVSGDLKRKGAYEHLPPGERNPLGWHQDMSALVVPKAAEAALVHGTYIREFITNHGDVFDFFLRARVTGGSRLEWGGDPCGKTVRYYISRDGDFLEKVMPPSGPVGQYKKANNVGTLAYMDWHRDNGNVWSPDIHTKNKSVYEERRTQIHTSWVVDLCNKVPSFLIDTDFADLDDYEAFRSNINLEWYIQEAEKLVIK